MSTYGKRTRHLFSASVTVVRSFDDMDGDVEQQVNEPILAVKINRLEIAAKRWRLPGAAPNRWSVTKIARAFYIIRLPFALIEIALDDGFSFDYDSKGYDRSGDWSEYHDRMVR